MKYSRSKKYKKATTKVDAHKRTVYKRKKKAKKK